MHHNQKLITETTTARITAGCTNNRLKATKLPEKESKFKLLTANLKHKSAITRITNAEIKIIVITS